MISKTKMIFYDKKTLINYSRNIKIKLKFQKNYNFLYRMRDE